MTNNEGVSPIWSAKKISEERKRNRERNGENSGVAINVTTEIGSPHAIRIGNATSKSANCTLKI
jgi:hypothetical protein